MPGEEASWIIPAAKTVIQHRKEIAEAWKVVLEYLTNQRRSIAFTGLPGAGKTVLFDYLSGAAYRAGYTPPPPSVSVEKGAVRALDQRLRVTVVPGDQSAPRLEALESLFSKRRAVDGVVHVVSNGLADVRNPFAREALAKRARLKSLEQFQKHQKKEELADLERTCELIRQSRKVSRKRPG